MRDGCFDAEGHHVQGVTFSAILAVLNQPGLPEIPAPAGCLVRRLPIERQGRGSVEAVVEATSEMARRNLRSVLFLCTGNYYRSRFAEILFNSVAGKMGLPWRASSRGLALERGVNNIGPMEASAIQTLEARGVSAGDGGARFPEQVTEEDLRAADRVVALSQAEHLPLLQERFPTWAERVEFWHVDDAPEALARIEQEVMGLIARLLGGGSRPEEPASAPPGKGTPEPARKPLTAKVGRETAGRRGKGVTTVFDLPLDDNGLKELAATLKQRCGTGGTVKDGRIEIQGDQRQRIVAELEKLGYKVKRVGG